MPKLNSLILREIGALSRCIQTISDISFKELQLQKGQFIYLSRVCENPGIHPRALTEMLKVDKTTATKALQKLEREGFILRRRDAEDARIWRLYPSPKAEDAYPKVLAAENRNIEICFQTFAAEDRETVYRLIRKMRENIETEWEAVKKNRGGQYD